MPIDGLFKHIVQWSATRVQNIDPLINELSERLRACQRCQHWVELGRPRRNELLVVKHRTSVCLLVDCCAIVTYRYIH